jgi:hypothetical protein
MPDDLATPPPLLARPPDDDPGGAPPVLPTSSATPADNDDSQFEKLLSGTSSNGEALNGEDEKGSGNDMVDSNGENNFGKTSSADIRHVVFQAAIDLMNTTSTNGGETPHELIFGKRMQEEQLDESELSDQQWTSTHPHYSVDHDKYEAAVALQPNDKYEAAVALLPDPPPTNAKVQMRLSWGKSKVSLQDLANKGIRKVLLTVKTIRRILNAKESIMKYGVFVPRNDGEADASPEHLRWKSGRMLEWMRLQEQGTFERNWD